MAVPSVGIIFESLTHETSANDATLRIGDEQFRMSELVNSQAATSAARALGVVEHEVFRLNISVDEMVGLAA